MSPAEAVRKKTLSLLADPENGLNPAFVHNCQRRQIEVPIPAGGNPDAPFDFGQGSATVFSMREDIDWLSRNSEQQYPCIVIFSGPSTQNRGGRPFGAIFFGAVTVEIRIYLAWITDDAPSDFEAPLDALEEAVFTVLNHSPSDWVPVIYENLLDVKDRMPLETVQGNDSILRRGVRFVLEAVVAI